MIASRKEIRDSNIGFIFCILILGMFIGLCALVMLQEYNFYQNTEKVYGEITNINVQQHSKRTSYEYYVSYTTVNGKKYNNIQAKYNGGLKGSNYSQGTPVIVCYNKSNPREVGLIGYKMNMGYIIMCIIYGLLIMVVIYVVFKDSKKLKLMKFLMKNGFMGTAQITNITRAKSGRKTRYVVDCVFIHPLTNQQLYVNDEVKYIRNLGINYQLNAYFDPKNPEIYFINLDEPKYENIYT